MSALLGLGVAYAIVDASLSEAAKISVRSGVVGGLYAISTAFGIGAFFGLIAARAGKALADVHNASAAMCLKVDRVSYDLLMRELCNENCDVETLLAASTPILVEASPRVLPSYFQGNSQEGVFSCLRSTDRLDDSARLLESPAIRLADNLSILNGDPSELTGLYSAALWRHTRIS